MRLNKKLILILITFFAIGLFILVYIFMIKINPSKSSEVLDEIINKTKIEIEEGQGIRTMKCYDPSNLSGKHNLPIPCLEDKDCNLFDENVIRRMKEFCSPAEVGFYHCGFKDFCGSDGYCKHDCRLI